MQIRYRDLIENLQIAICNLENGKASTVALDHLIVKIGEKLD